MIPPDRREMEAALAASWPVPWTEDCGDFELRASPENSNRGNCVRLISEQQDVRAVIETARPFFERHHRPLQIGVSDPLRGVDEQLAALGLGAINPSLIMSRRAQERPDEAIPDRIRVQGEIVASEGWLAAWADCAELGTARDEHFSIARKMCDRAYFVSLYDDTGLALAVGSYVCHGRWRCFGNLATRKAVRGRGIGSLVLTTLSAHRPPGVDADLLQVDRPNPAVRLYRNHEFGVAYSYHYRRAGHAARSASEERDAPRGA